MDPDLHLKRDVEAELARDPAVDAAAIGVSVRDGVVTLNGHIGTYVEKTAVEKALQRVPGIRAVALELDVRLAPQHRLSDTDIARAAEALLEAAVVPRPDVRLKVDNGWVTLQGEVDWDFQRRACEKALRTLTGVVGLTNEIAPRRSGSGEDIEQRIEQALQRQAVRDAHRVQVQHLDGTVTLRGRVHSWQEREAAAGAAFSAPGVDQVVNLLTVG